MNHEHYPRPILTVAEMNDDDDDDTVCERPCVAPPADDRAALVRFDLASTARRQGYAALSLVIATASTRETWQLISADFASARCRTGDSQVRGVLTSAAYAAEAMGRRDTHVALSHLADPCGLSVEEWLTVTRDERAKAARS